MDCIFCAIVADKAPASRVMETARALAFMDIRPATPGHALVIPKRHATDLADLDPEDGAEMFRVAQRVTQAVRRSSIPCQGVNLFLADGAVAGQEVFHAHLHVLPRTPGDGIGIAAQFGQPGRDELDEQARDLAAQLS